MARNQPRKLIRPNVRFGSKADIARSHCDVRLSPRKRTFVDWRLRAKGGDAIMKAFVFACVAAVVIAIIGAIVLGGMQESADHAFSSSAVRLGP